MLACKDIRIPVEPNGFFRGIFGALAAVDFIAHCKFDQSSLT